jgi:hypothetical protein
MCTTPVLSLRYWNRRRRNWLVNVTQTLTSVCIYDYASHLTSLTFSRTIDPMYPGGSKWCVCHLLCFIRGFFTHPASLDREHKGNETCLCVMSSFLTSIARSYIPVSLHLVLFSITKPTIEVFYLYSCL